MGWLIAWVALSMLSWVAVSVMLVGVPSSERASTGGFLKVFAYSFGAWGAIVLCAFGLWSALQGIF